MIEDEIACYQRSEHIARPNGDLDFLPPGGVEPHNYDELMASVDALVIGRKTFETVLAFPAWPLRSEKRCGAK